MTENTPTGTLSYYERRSVSPSWGVNVDREEEASPSSQTIPVTRADRNRHIPLLRFSSGATDDPVKQQLLTAFNATEYSQVLQVLEEHETRLLRFQAFNIRWLVQGVRRQPVGDWRRLAERDALTPLDHAVIAENDAFMLILQGAFAEAKHVCAEGIRRFPTCEGLWVNLLVAMVKLRESQQVEQLLFDMPRLVDLDRGFLGLYLGNEPDLCRPVCNGG